MTASRGSSAERRGSHEEDSVDTAALALALAVAACGKGGAEESSTPSGGVGDNAVDAGPGATADTITLG